MYIKILANVHDHVRQFYGNCQNLQCDVFILKTKEELITTKIFQNKGI